jgi:YVTN family beta-propeller protein
MSRGRQPDRFLATILFTDIVGSTDLAAKLGDTQWRRLVAAHHAAVRAQLRKFGGKEIDTAGDGFLCSFEQPAQAVRAADAILAEVARLGLTLRAGVHTGEAERTGGGKLGGIAVHIAARIMATAGDGKVLVSGTVRDLVAGSRLGFTDAGVHELKGVPGEWHLYELVREVPAAIEATLPPAIDDAAADASQGRRRNIALAAVAAIAVVALLAVAALLAGGFLNPPAAVIAQPGPDTVVTIDAAAGKITDVHAVPANPVAIVLDSSTHRLWVASLDAGVVIDFAISGAPGDRTTGRVGRPTDLAIGDGVIWVADAFDETVTLIDAATGEPQRTVEGVLARHIDYGFGSAWATDDVADRVLRLDRQSGDVAQSADLGSGAYPTGIAVGNDAIWVGNAGLSTITRVDPSSATVAQAGIALRAVPDSLAAGSGAVWIAGRDNDVVVRLDPATNSVSQTIPVGDQPVSLAVDGDTVWVGCAGTSEVWHLDRDGTVLVKIAVGGVPSDIYAADGRVYVTVRRG